MLAAVVDGGWEVEETSSAFVCCSGGLEVEFLDCSGLVCWLGWEGADGSIVRNWVSNVLGGGETDLEGLGGWKAGECCKCME